MTYLLKYAFNCRIFILFFIFFYFYKMYVYKILFKKITETDLLYFVLSFRILNFYYNSPSMKLKKINCHVQQYINLHLGKLFTLTRYSLLWQTFYEIQHIIYAHVVLIDMSLKSSTSC